MFAPIKKGLRAVGTVVWKLFLNGLLAILPLTITIAILHVLYKIIKAWFDPIHEFVNQHMAFKAFPVPYIEVVVIVFFIFAIGAFLNVVILRTIIHKAEKLIDKVPLVRAIYSGIKQLTGAFGAQDKETFKKVVLVEFPKAGIYSVGFLTSELSTELAPSAQGPFFTVFVPTTPNPTSGFFLVLTAKEVHATNLTRQEAMKLIISGGIIQPERHIRPQ
jgi:uncharacterized membrane protein